MKLIVDKEARFTKGQQVEISTQTGWIHAIVQEVLVWPHDGDYCVTYKVLYVPAWEKDGKSYYTVVTGHAVR